jgi:hypothetical protein
VKYLKHEAVHPFIGDSISFDPGGRNCKSEQRRCQKERDSLKDLRVKIQVFADILKNIIRLYTSSNDSRPNL